MHRGSPTEIRPGKAAVAQITELGQTSLNSMSLSASRSKAPGPLSWSDSPHHSMTRLHSFSQHPSPLQDLAPMTLQDTPVFSPFGSLDRAINAFNGQESDPMADPSRMGAMHMNYPTAKCSFYAPRESGNQAGGIIWQTDSLQHYYNAYLRSHVSAPLSQDACTAPVGFVENAALRSEPEPYQHGLRPEDLVMGSNSATHGQSHSRSSEGETSSQATHRRKKSIKGDQHAQSRVRQTPGSSPPGPIPATTPLVVQVDADGVQWIVFDYSRDRVTQKYTIRCDVDSVDQKNDLNDDFKSVNCVYPCAYKTTTHGDEYKGNRFGYETQCNDIGWALAHLNEDLRGKRGLIQRAVDSWRNSNANHKMRSRRVRRQNKISSRRERHDSATIIPTTKPGYGRLGAGLSVQSNDLSNGQGYSRGWTIPNQMVLTPTTMTAGVSTMYSPISGTGSGARNF